MALKAILTGEEFEKLPEGHQAFYTQHDDEHRLDVESVGGWALDNIDGLRNTLTKLKTSNTELKAWKESKAAELDGFDMDEAKKAMERVKALEGNEGKFKEQIEAIRKDITESFEQKNAALATENESLTKQLTRQIVESAATMALSKHKADAELLMPHIAKCVQAVRGDDGEYTLRIFGPDGLEALSKQTGRNAEPMDMDELVGSAMKQRFPAAYDGSGATGSGATGSSRSGSGGRYSISEEQARNDPRAYQRVRAEAAKAGQQVTITE
jgi:regulator of replication initiation timing